MLEKKYLISFMFIFLNPFLEKNGNM